MRLALGHGTSVVGVADAFNVDATTRLVRGLHMRLALFNGGGCNARYTNVNRCYVCLCFVLMQVATGGGRGGKGKKGGRTDKGEKHWG